MAKGRLELVTKKSNKSVGPVPLSGSKRKANKLDMLKKIVSITIVTFAVAFLSLSFPLPDFINIKASIPGVVGEEEAQESLPAKTYTFPVSLSKAYPTPQVTPRPVTKKVSVVNSSFHLQIPSLGISAPVVLEQSTNQNKVYSALERGVVHYADTPLPGELGTSIILGHSSSYSWYKGSYGKIFASLADLKEGDTIIILKDGKPMTFEVKKSLIFSPSTVDDYALRDLESTSGSSLILMTCWPVGTNAKRIAVRADLI